MKKVREKKRAICRGFSMLVLAIFVLSIASAAYADNPFHKFKRGVINSATSWIEVPKTIYEESKETDPVTGLVYGSMKGSGKCIMRTGAAAMDTSTFLFPSYDEPLLEPEYVL